MHSYESLVLRKAEQSQTRGCKKSVRGAGVTLLQKKVTVCLKERRGGAALTMSLSLGDLFSFLYMYILVATFFNSKVQQWPATRAIIIRTRLTTAACGINHPPPSPFRPQPLYASVYTGYRFIYFDLCKVYPPSFLGFTFFVFHRSILG